MRQICRRNIDMLKEEAATAAARDKDSPEQQTCAGKLSSKVGGYSDKIFYEFV